MHFSKRIITIAAAAAMSFCIAGKKECTATAADAPANIHLTVETKEIAIEDISDNRVVTLNVYQENCPPFDHMTIMFKKDPRLGFYPEFECFRNAEGVQNARKPDISYNVEIDPDYRMCAVVSSFDNDSLVEFDNAVVKVSFKLPEQLSPGDFFGVDLLREFNGSVIQIGLGKMGEDTFKDAPFTQLNGGGIRIVEKEQPAPTHAGNGGGDQGGNDQGGGSQNGGSPPQTGGDTVTQEVTAQATTAAVSETSVETATSRITSTTSATTSTSSTSSAVSSATSTTTVISTGAQEETERGKNDGLLRIGIITLIAAAVSSLILLVSRIKMNKK